ncbi:MAG TPA: 30S ribosomal protein S12 methylthiotransferase RimO [Sphaerochaeta sp.]|jgi:ribosomal protein S12 methylthiotransferase|uniref:30S ribosomal protein S12 methylthiotransferase RimO n=1 Tax=Sphaerochaeta sp. TaxID=1972642 RepID=UPI000EC34D02|nr:30S ribosomal protein S12 methylthiotransferase RimO [Sphaerochaeta sp.]MCK9599787.1 30S ribosomal protein S12 methylthiotransferase RimO [Sphaerochaeta sp.]MDX9823937.1 30S ribosomal protein S12 methylthiotransferase RimO [Sphaerochaeta sp.]HAP57932.1 30S ribosomal protein S12 methylthiotransferase RimO [Sphaerochaeta sp.]
MKKVYMENLGCSKNQVDAETLIKLLEDDRFIHTGEVGEADLIVVNTCGFIESARQQSLESFFSLHEANPEAKIILSGCMAQRYAKELEQELGEASAIFGNRDLSRIHEVVEQIFAGDRVVSLPSYPPIENEVYERNELLSFPGSAYLKISEGCNHWCSYCAIPLIRGALRSKPMQVILAEAKDLIGRGIKEINLIAQDLAAYGTDGPDKQSKFMQLLEALVALEGDFSIRLLYIHPDAFPRELIPFIAEHKKVLPYFDIPFQHADEHVLRSMGRTGTKESYLALIDAIRSTVAEAVIRSTILLGYPGEDEKAFAEVMDFLSKAKLDWVGSFIYSREEGTKAYKLRGEREHKKANKVAQTYQQQLQALQAPITSANLKRFVGKEYEVLIEELVEGEDLAIGRMYAQAPEVDGLTVVVGRSLKPGRKVLCGIRSVNGLDLEAIPVQGVLHG